jgi:NADPH-dependent ferric siderophore reductase
MTGVAQSAHVARLLNEMCEHFIEHAEVRRIGDEAIMTSKLGVATFRLQGEKLSIALNGPSEAALQMARTSIAEHMFYFAGSDPLEISWADTDAAAPSRMPNLHEVTVLGAEDVTPLMRRVKFSCADVTPFIGGDMHVRLLIPPKGRKPVWPGYRADGRVAWPRGEDELAVRAYTIRAVDAERGELWIDFLQHFVPGTRTPGAEFAQDARPGDLVGLMGPGSGALPVASSILMIGDETALPAIARIAAEVSADTEITAIIEVADAAEEQMLHSAGRLNVRWLHRGNDAEKAKGVLLRAGKDAIEAVSADTFVWAACEKEDIRAMRTLLNRRKHDRSLKYVAWYWER